MEADDSGTMKFMQIKTLAEQKACALLCGAFCKCIYNISIDTFFDVKKYILYSIVGAPLRQDFREEQRR